MANPRCLVANGVFDLCFENALSTWRSRKLNGSRARAMLQREGSFSSNRPATRETFSGFCRTHISGQRSRSLPSIYRPSIAFRRKVVLCTSRCSSNRETTAFQQIKEQHWLKVRYSSRYDTYIRTLKYATTILEIIVNYRPVIRQWYFLVHNFLTFVPFSGII